jgi:hypothetical protein
MCLSWTCAIISECRKIKCECSKECCKNIPIKRYFIPFIAVIGLAYYEEFRQFTYFPIIVSSAFFVLFWNFPVLVYITASKPLYYEDLFIDEKKLPNYDVDPKIKEKFQTMLIWILIISNCVFVGVLADYWLYKTTNITSYLEIIGVTGGIIKIFQMINNSISKGMIKILKSCIKKENKRFRKDQKERIERIISLKKIESKDNIMGMEMINIVTTPTNKN